MNVLLKLFTILCILIYMSNISECARILCVFSAPILTHNIVLRRLSDGLLRRGHEIVLWTSFPEHSDVAVANLTEIDVSEITYQAWRTVTDEWSIIVNEDLRGQKELIVKITAEVCFAQLKHQDVQKIIKNENSHFDLIFIETPAKPFYILSYIFKAPTILVSSMGELIQIKEFGVPSQPVLYPPFMAPKFNELSFWETIYAIYDHYWFQNVCMVQDAINAQILKKRFGEDTPDLNELSNNLDMMFLNVHTTWDANRPVPLGIIFGGGLHLVPEKKLPEDLRLYMDSSKNGIIYMSFGTNVTPSLFQRDKLNILLNVLSKLPYNVLFKWDQDHLPGCPENIKTFKWLPQADLLHHPKVKLFITQGGLQSTDEAITAGKPLVGIPILGDQWFNTEKYKQHKIGIKLDIDTLTEEQFKDAIETVILNETYRQNVIKLRNIMYDKPQSSLDNAIWWTEYVLRHNGAEQLRSPGANIPWSEFYEVEIMIILLLTMIVVIYLFIFSTILLNKMIIQKLCKLIKQRTRIHI